jgi:hypothetical protein
VHRFASALLSVLAVTLAAGVARAADPQTLEDRAAAIERVSTERDGGRVVLGHLSRKLHMPVDDLRTQREQTGLGWGELLIANLVSKASGLTVDQVAGEFRGGMTWEEIALAHHVNVDKLVVDVASTQEIVEDREEDRAPTVTQKEGPRRPGPAAHPAGGEAGEGTGRGRRY